MQNLKKSLLIYLFGALFIVGFNISSYISNSDTQIIQFTETANANLITEVSDCKGFKQGIVSDTRIITMCNCSTQRAKGEIACDAGEEPEEEIEP